MRKTEKRKLLNTMALAIVIIAILIAYVCGRQGGGINGTYEFGEFTPPDKVLQYVVQLKGKKADVSVNGFETDLDMKTQVVQNGNGYDLVFDSYGDGKTPNAYKRGDVLLTLYPAEAGMQVEWRAMQPDQAESLNGRVFTKMK